HFLVMKKGSAFGARWFQYKNHVGDVALVNWNDPAAYSYGADDAGMPYVARVINGVADIVSFPWTATGGAQTEVPFMPRAAKNSTRSTSQWFIYRVAPKLVPARMAEPTWYSWYVDNNGIHASLVYKDGSEVKEVPQRPS